MAGLWSITNNYRDKYHNLPWRHLSYDHEADLLMSSLLSPFASAWEMRDINRKFCQRSALQRLFLSVLVLVQLSVKDVTTQWFDLHCFPVSCTPEDTVTPDRGGCDGGRICMINRNLATFHRDLQPKGILQEDFTPYTTNSNCTLARLMCLFVFSLFKFKLRTKLN